MYYDYIQIVEFDVLPFSTFFQISVIRFCDINCCCHGNACKRRPVNTRPVLSQGLGDGGRELLKESHENISQSV